MRKLGPRKKRNSAQFAAVCDALLERGAQVKFRAHGQSMQPNILDEDVVIVVRADSRDLRRGDVALTRGRDGFKVHRVLETVSAGRAIVTRSDSGEQDDPATELVLGKVVAVERRGRRHSFAFPGQRYVHASRSFLYQFARAAALRAAKLASASAFFAAGILITWLLSAAPAAYGQTADLQLTQTASAPAVAAGSNFTYTEVVTNNTSSATVTTGTITVYMQTPANTTYQSSAGTNWTCTAPAAGTAGPVVCTYNAALASGVTASSLTVTFQVAAGTAAGTTIQGSATVTNSTYTDTVPSNNTSLTSVVVEPAASADLGVSMSVSPTPVFISSSMTYSIIVQNLGQASAAISSNVLQDILPSGANGVTFASIVVPSGWSCTTPAVGSSGTVQCSITTAMPALPAAGATVSFTITVNTPASPTTLSNTVTVNLTGDPNSSNNAATSYTVVQPIACATPGKDGAGGTLTGIVNAYYPPAATGILAAGSTSVTVGAAAGAPAAQRQISAGDLLLIIQMQGAAINNSNASTYGHGVPGDPGAGSTNLGNSGLFEFVTATNTTAIPVTGGTVQFTGTGPTGGLLNTYTYAHATASTSLGSATAASWSNGIASFTFATPLPAGIVLSSVLTTTGFTPVAYNLTEAPILSVNTTTGVLTVALTTNPGTETALGTGSFVTVGQQTYQVIRVPQYTSATLSSGLVPLAWNGALTAGGNATNLGGVLAIDVSSQLTLGGTVALDALGFRGGGGITLRGAATAGDLDTDYVTSSPAALPVIGAKDAPNGSGANASKGEGIAGTPHWIAPILSSITTSSTAVSTAQSVLEGYIGGSFARGAPGNAGGGGTDGDPLGNPINTGVGNDQNSGGGAGGNGGSGGQGGYGWDSIAKTNSTDGGFGGVAFSPSTSALVMGGGGGAGSTNNGSYYTTAGNNFDCGSTCTGIFSSGGYGGGIAIIHAGSVVGTGTITSNGQSTLSTDKDSTGGAGAGGSILVFANSGGLSGLTVSAMGGSGGNAWQIEPPGTPFPGERHGPGGGGGGGVIFLSATPNAASSVAGGSNGYTDTVQDSYGSTPGQPGLLVTTDIVTETPGTQSGAYCAGADLSVTNSGTPNPVLAGPGPGNVITYTQNVTNSGPLDALNATFNETIPANTTFQSLSVPGGSGWLCNAPPVGNTGTISCTNPDVANAASTNFTVTVAVNTGVAAGTVITDVVNASSGTNDPNLNNNSATVQTTVAQSGMADLAVTNSALSDSNSTTIVVPTSLPTYNGDITYTQTVTNNGPSAASSVVLTEPIPANTTFVSAAPNPASGWTCGTASGTLTCSANSGVVLNSGSSETFTVVVNVPSGVSSGTAITDTAQVSSTTTDPNPNNNSATSVVTVATSGQSDLAVTSSASPNPVTDGNNISYAQLVTNNGPAASGLATFTDTIPAGATFVSLAVPGGWNCGTLPAVGSTGGTITCTIASLAVNASASFPLVLKAALGDTPGTSITNVANINNSPCSSASDPNCSNNSASTNVVVASPTQADVAITKTANPDPVDQGTNLQYTLQVTNNGPAAAQGVTVTDPLPGQVTYVTGSVATTQGTCTYTASTTTISCSLGTVSVGGLVLITFNVNANTFSSSTLATNTATVSATTGDPNLTNNSSTVVSTIAAPTAVQIASFRAIPRQGGGILLEWKTREEIRNLGFNVFRLGGQNRQRLNPSLIAGSALLIRGGLPQHAAKTYQWFDPEGTVQSVYELEDVDLNGTRMPHGPVSVDAAASSSGAIARPMLLTQMSRAIVQPSVSRERVLSTPRPVIPSVAQGTVPVSLDAYGAVKILVDSEGWVQVSKAQLVAAGLEPNLDARYLQLYAEGIEQPLLIVGRQSGALGPNDSIEFYGTGINTPFSGTRVYWLIRGSHPGLRVSAVPAVNTTLSEPQSFPFTVVLEQRTTYFATLLNGENNDNFFGAPVTSEPVDQPLTVAHADPNSSMQISVDITLQGATDQQGHSVSVQFNGVSIGEIDFANLANVTQTFPVDRSLLLDGVNTVTLTALQGDNDVSVVQTIALHYPHTYASDGSWLKATAPAGETIHVTGFSNSQIQVFDITNPLAISQLSGKVALEGASYGVTLGIPQAGAQERTLLVFSDDQLSPPSGLAFHKPSKLAEQRTGSQMVVITHPDFESALAPLVKWHESRGQSVEVVTIDEVFDAFNYGERSPFAIRDFLQNAATHWSRKPQYLLLVGDASLDPRNYLGMGDFDFVPTRIIETAAFKTATDDWFSDFKQNGYPTIATGRLPVRSASDAELVVSKIVNFEKGFGASAAAPQALLVADQNIDADFTTATKFAATNLPSSLQPTEIFANGQDPAIVSHQILAALNNGPILVNYSGHGSVEQWSFSDLLDDSSATSLSNGDRLSVYLLMDCLNGFFQDVYSTSLAESLLLAPNGGAVAVWASSGFTNQPPQASMNQAVLQLLKTNPSMSLGTAIVQAKSGITDNDVRRTWIFFGDPAMTLQLPPASASGGPPSDPGPRRDKKFY